MLPDRLAFYRGEEVTVAVSYLNSGPNEIPAATASVSIAGLVDVKRSFGPVRPGERVTRQLRLPTAQLRPGKYQCEIQVKSADEILATEQLEFVLAARPKSDRMPVWLWPHKAFLDQLTNFDDNSKQTLQWWSDHGVTDFAVGENPSDDMLKALDFTLGIGVNACLMPNGGLTSAGAFADEPADSDVWFRPQRESADLARRLLNPLHPRVTRWHTEAVESLMSKASRYPHIRSAFFNTEIVDELSNSENVAAKRQMQEELGYGANETGETKFVEPGVVADDDRRLQLHRFAFKRGNGLVEANSRTAAIVNKYRPDILTINDPYRSWALLDGFPGIDVVGSWTYTNPDPKLMLYAETLRAACANTNQQPLSIVTLLNYPGEQTPSEKDWTMMGPGRLAVTTWINLSRAPRMLGYYFSSACDPFSALEDDLVTPKKDTSAEALPPSTYEMLQRLSSEVFQPFGSLIRNCQVAPRRIAVLNSDTAGLFRTRSPLLGHYRNLQAHHFYTVLAMAHLPADIVLDEQVARDGLGKYDVLVLPQCDVLPKSVYDQVLKFADRGGMVICDQFLGPQVPGAIRFDFDFAYRSKVTAMAIASGRGFQDWDDHLQPDDAKVHSVEGVSALEDQKIMESYAQTLRDSLGDQVEREVDCNVPTALINLLEADGGKYLVVVNDKRDYDDTFGRYRSVLDKIVPQTVSISLPGWKDETLVVYDLLLHKRLKSAKVDGVQTFDVELSDLGGTILSFLPQELAGVQLNVPGEVALGRTELLSITMSLADGSSPQGIQPVQVSIIDSQGNEHELSGCYNLTNGFANLEFAPAMNDSPGKWKILVKDLTAGSEATSTIDVVAPAESSPVVKTPTKS